MLKISVVIICYNQKEIIRRAIDSVLKQSSFGLYEIVISDDCSSDGTWDILLDYQNKYPRLIKPYQNNPNLGIYANLQKALAYVDYDNTDAIQLLSGDDALCENYYEEVQKFISCSVNIKNELFTIYSDWKTFNPEGKELFFYNNLAVSSYNKKSLKLRQLIYNRSIISSKHVYEKYYPVPTDRGISVAECLFDMQIQIHTNTSYYVPFVGSIYYAGIGISTKMNDENSRNNLIAAYQEYLKMNVFSSSDIRFIKYRINRLAYENKKSIVYFIKTWWYFLSSIKYRINIKSMIIDFITMIIK